MSENTAKVTFLRKSYEYMVEDTFAKTKAHAEKLVKQLSDITGETWTVDYVEDCSTKDTVKTQVGIYSGVSYSIGRKRGE